MNRISPFGGGQRGRIRVRFDFISSNFNILFPPPRSPSKGGSESHMQKLILISPENSITEEIRWIQAMLELDENLRFHLRKPRWSKEDCLEYLLEISPLFYDRISIHQYHDLQLNFPKIGLHFKEKDREDFINSSAMTSTSFHSEIEAIELGIDYDYFFCSPVFPSISKKGYDTEVKWNINGWNEQLRKKAVALGGIDSKTILDAKELGFTTFAVLGSVWMSKNPFEAFKEMYEICQK